MPDRFIAISGNIGVGKTSLVSWLGNTYGIQPVFEPFEDNPYLEDFYEDMKASGFHSQMWFLSHKFRLHQDLNTRTGVFVQDRTIYEDAEIFATHLARSRRMSKRDFETYLQLVAQDLPEDLVFHVNYLGGDMPTFTLNFSRAGNQVVGQYYNFLRLGREGYTTVMEALRDIATRLSGEIARLGPFELLSDGSAIPVFAFKMKPGSSYSVYDLSDKLRQGGWQVPAYTMPEGAEDVAVLAGLWVALNYPWLFLTLLVIFVARVFSIENLFGLNIVTVDGGDEHARRISTRLVCNPDFDLTRQSPVGQSVRVLQK